MDYSEDAQNFYLNEQNKKKQKEIEEKFGGDFYKPEDSDLPPELENAFLENVMRFEEEWENAKEIEMFMYLGKPKFKNLNEIAEIDLPAEIEKVLGVYTENNIYISVVEEEDVSDKDFYKFLTEELTRHKFYPMPGMNTNFIYEEFHPSDKLDAKNAVKDVLLHPFFPDKDYGPTYLAKDDLLNSKGEPVTEDEFLDELNLIYADIEELIEREFVYKNFEFGELNFVNVDFIIRYKEKDNPAEIDKIFNFTLELRRSEYGGMEVLHCKLNN